MRFKRSGAMMATMTMRITQMMQHIFLRTLFWY